MTKRLLYFPVALFSLIALATGSLHAQAPDAADAAEKKAERKKARVAKALEIIDDNNLRAPTNFFGAALLTILTTRSDKIPKVDVKGVADTVFPTLAAHGPLLDLRDHCAGINGVSVVSFDMLSGDAFSFIYIVVGARGPVAIKVNAFVAPDRQMNLSDIDIIEAWPDIEDALSRQLRLPAYLNILRAKKKDI